jgi:hypothetical protein
MHPTRAAATPFPFDPPQKPQKTARDGQFGADPARFSSAQDDLIGDLPWFFRALLQRGPAARESVVHTFPPGQCEA